MDNKNRRPDGETASERLFRIHSRNVKRNDAIFSRRVVVETIGLGVPLNS